MGSVRSRALVSAFLVLPLSLFVYGEVHAQDAGAVQARRTELQLQLDELERQIEVQQTILTEKQKERTSLERDVAILDAQIAEAKLAIKRRTLVIQQLTANIQQKENTIFGLNRQLNSELESLAAILRQKNELGNTSLVIAALSSEDFSEFFSDLDTFDTVNRALQESFVEIRGTRTVTEGQKADLEQKRQEEVQLRQVQQLQEERLHVAEREKQKILTETRGQEKAYQDLIVANQKTAAQIRSELFQLTGSAAIPFEKALEYANLAAKETGVRPAFLLGVIAEESNLGENLGSGSWRIDMHQTRDAPIFVEVTASLGLNPDVMPVSKKPWYGWGGAMGPAQFIPSTWALYAGYVKPDWHYDVSKDRIGRRTGNQPPNPWDPKDAFMAAALLLTDNGAAAKTYNAEFRAAMCYLAGCSSSKNKSLQFYGNEVMALTDKYQNQINILGGS